MFYPPPQIRAQPSGEPVPFPKLCKKAGMRMVVSANNLPDVRVHGESVDFKVVAPGRVTYCVGLPLLEGDIHEKSRQILQKLAYQFHDWAAREVVAAHNRAVKRTLPEAAEIIRRALAPTPFKILLFLRETGKANVSEISSELKLAQPHVSRAIRVLEDARLIVVERIGRDVIAQPVKSNDISMEIVARSIVETEQRQCVP